MKWRYSVQSLAFAVALWSGVAAMAQEQGNVKQRLDFSSLSLPALIEADDLRYDQEAGIVRANGNVEVVQGERMLLADAIIYEKDADKVIAQGNVSLMEPDGTVFFADEIVLRQELKTGIVRGFSARLGDSSLVAANYALRKEKGVTVLEKAVYSPCPVCKDDGSPKKPLWQLKAGKATIDENTERVTYRHASLDVKGVPVLYTPYFSHATPNAKRKSGFLTPRYRNDSIFGVSVTTPYYYTIAPNMDATITPTITSNEGPILEGEFRHMIASGSYEFSGSMTNPEQIDDEGNKISGRDFRGHIEGKGNFDINDQWSWGFDGKRASDDTYLRRYQFGHEDVLRSHAYVNRVENRQFFSVDALSFQGLQESDDPGETPFILPQATFHWESDPGYKNSKWALDSDLLMLVRDEGVSSNRLSVDGSWTMPYITKGGHLFALETSLRADGYWVDDVPDSNGADSHDGATGRIIPQVKANWAYPLVRQESNTRFFFEPTVDVIVSPYGGNPEEIPNEDSQDVEFTDEALFTDNHFTGLDRVEQGPRTNYGIRGGVEHDRYGRMSVLFGQSYRVKRNRDFEENTGLSNHFSDFVGRVGYQTGDVFDIAYRFRFDKDSLSPRRNEVIAGLNIAPLTLHVDYLSLDERFIENNTVGLRRELVQAGAKLDITEQWAIETFGHRDIEDSEWISSKVNLVYDGDCIDVTFSWFEEFTEDRDIEPNSTFSLQISLQNLGY